MRAEGHKHMATLWRGEKPWHWWSLARGLAQPNRFVWVDQYRWRFHLTPIHLERWGEAWEIGVCAGFRTIYLRRHR